MITFNIFLTIASLLVIAGGTALLVLVIPGLVTFWGEGAYLKFTVLVIAALVGITGMVLALMAKPLARRAAN